MKFSQTLAAYSICIVSLLQLVGASATLADEVGDAERALAAGQYKEAQTLLMSAIQKAPHNATTHYLLGNADYKLGDENSARTHYISAIKIAPESDAAALSNVAIRELGKHPLHKFAYIPHPGQVFILHQPGQQRRSDGTFGLMAHCSDGTTENNIGTLSDEFEPGPLDTAAHSQSATTLELSNEMNVVLQSMLAKKEQDLRSIQKQRKLAFEPDRNYDEEIQTINKNAVTVQNKITDFYGRRKAGSTAPPLQYLGFQNLYYNGAPLQAPGFPNHNYMPGAAYGNPGTAPVDPRLAPLGNNRTTKNYKVDTESDNSQIQLRAAAKALQPAAQDVKK